MTILADNNVVYAFVVHLYHPADAIVVLVKKECTVIRTYYDIALCGFGQACYAITAKKVGMLCVAAEYKYLVSVVTTNTTALGAIPEVTFRVLYHMRHMLG